METYLIVLVVLFAAIFIGLVFNYMYKQTNYYKNQFVDAVKFKDKEFAAKIDIVNLGSNHPKFAFDYSDLTVNGMNWAIGPQSFEYDFRILKEYHRLLNKEAFVIIPVCPLKFFLHRYSYDSANYKYYKILDSSLINNYSPITKLLHIDYPILTAKRNVLRLVKDVSIDNRMVFETNPMKDEELKADAKKWINGWLKQFSLDSLETSILSKKNEDNIQTNISILKEMIDFCLERKYQPILVTLPLTNYLLDLIPESFINEHIIGNINKANVKDVLFLNYMKDERFTSEDLYFNSFFFNRKGRKLFTKEIVNQLTNKQ